MATKFFVPKFITIEDRLAGLLTFRQLFALLGAFLLSFFVFRINHLLGFLTGLISFASASLLTFVYINGKPLMNILPRVLDFFFRSRKFAWQRIEKITYKEVVLPKELDTEARDEVWPRARNKIVSEAGLPKIPQRKIITDQTEVILEYPETNTKEKLTISLKEPMALQAEEINRFVHRHLLNPQNPYRLFPYVKFYRTLR
jgi:hypothetical protein